MTGDTGVGRSREWVARVSEGFDLEQFPPEALAVTFCQQPS